MATIVSITYSPPAETPRPKDCYHRVAAPRAVLIADRGIDGDRKSKGGDRQINVMSAAALSGLAAEGFQTAPGQMGEQIVIEGIDVDSLAKGSRLQLGRVAVIETVIPRTGCDRFEHIQGKFKGLARGRMGQIVRVIVGGPITVGDSVLIQDAERSAGLTES
jgi:MOSC domain-containing protein YiiM